MSDLHERLWGDNWIAELKLALGIEFQVDSIILKFASSEPALFYVNGGEAQEIPGAFGIMPIKRILGMQFAAKEIRIVIRKGQYVNFITYDFTPLEVSVGDLIGLFKE